MYIYIYYRIYTGWRKPGNAWGEINNHSEKKTWKNHAWSLKMEYREQDKKVLQFFNLFIFLSNKCFDTSFQNLGFAER